MVVVTGMHRSGTTFLGSLLYQANRYAYLHEPFNKEYGIRGVKDWYPYVSVEDTTGNYARLLNALHDLDISFKIPEVRDCCLLKRLSRRVFRSRGNIDLVKYRTVFRGRELLVKDPFLSLCAANLAARHRDVKVIYMVRHPVAVYESLHRMGWSFDLQALKQQTRLMEDYSTAFDFELTPYMALHKIVAWLWKALYMIINDQVRIVSRNVCVIRHEDLSTNPQSEVARLFEFLGERIDNRVHDFINKNMFSDKVKPDGTVLHDFSRNSRELAYSWMKSPKHEYDEIISITGDVLNTYGYQ